MKEKLSAFSHKLFGTKPNDGDLQPKEAITYSIAGFGQNLICTVIGSYLTIFMTDAIGFGALAVALLMLFTRIYDALNDPIMGSIVDRTRSQYGKCRPYLKWMAIPIAIMTILCFLPVYKNDVGSFVGISVVYVIWSMVYTVADVPYWGLSTAMTADTMKRGNMLTVARLFCTAGAGLVTLIIPLITAPVSEKYGVNAGPELAKVYFWSAVVLVIIALPLFYVGFYGTKERMITTTKPPSLAHNLKLLFKNKPLMLIVISGILGSARMAYTYTGGLYFAKYVLANVEFLGMKGEALYTLITMAIIPGGLVASVMVPWFTKRFGKRNTFIVSHLVGAAMMFVVFFVGIANKESQYTDPATLIVALIGLVVLGVPQGFSNILTYAMIGDTVEYLELKTGERAEGICFAMQTFMNKISMAVGAFIGVLAYYMAGVTPNNPGALDPQGKDVMWYMLVLLGALSLLGTAIPLFFYKFNEKEQREAAAIILARKQQEALTNASDEEIASNAEEK